MYKRPTILVFLDLKAAFDSVNREVLWQCLSIKGVPQRYINLIKPLYSVTTGRVRAYGELPREISSSSGVHQGCLLSSFLFNFAIDVLLEVPLTSFNSSGIHLLPGRLLVDLKYVDDTILFSEDADNMQSPKHLE